MSISLPICSGTIGNITQLTVDARSLHCALEVKRDFSNWIKARIEKYGFIEGEDYEKSSMIPSSPKMANGLKVAIEYRLSVNMGKELAMVENNERGKLVRRYFIECERRLKESDSLTIEDRRPLSVLIGQWAGKAKMSFPDCWRELHAVFGITTVSELPSSQLPAALAWVQAKIDGLSPSVHSDIHSDIHSNVPTMSPSVPNVPDFPMELANSGRKGDKVLNLWEELEELRMKLASCNNMVFFTCTSGRLMFLPPEKLLLHEILRDSVKQAQDSLSQAQRAVQSALRLKHRVDFHNI